MFPDVCSLRKKTYFIIFVWQPGGNGHKKNVEIVFDSFCIILGALNPTYSERLCGKDGEEINTARVAEQQRMTDCWHRR